MLQNLKYERFHLEKEISLTDAFETIYQTIDLISEEHFVSDAPKELVETEASLEGATKDHQRMLNRLTFELNERKRLSQVIEELQHKKLKLTKEIKGSENEVNKLDKELDALLTVMPF
jgi:THO complex subunit 5